MFDNSEKYLFITFQKVVSNTQLAIFFLDTNPLPSKMNIFPPICLDILEKIVL